MISVIWSICSVQEPNKYVYTTVFLYMLIFSYKYYYILSIYSYIYSFIWWLADKSIFLWPQLLKYKRQNSMQVFQSQGFVINKYRKIWCIMKTCIHSPLWHRMALIRPILDEISFYIQVVLKYTPESQRNGTVWVGLDFMGPGENWNFVDESSIHSDIEMINSNEVRSYMLIRWLENRPVYPYITNRCILSDPEIGVCSWRNCMLSVKHRICLLPSNYL